MMLGGTRRDIGEENDTKKMEKRKWATAAGAAAAL